ncbi:DUF2975 domain-containing protein [Dyella sp. C9]|uniref:DUF2975 domain-containing protein n=1 Tax=Dyella sp. C9 TaxID=2202154 RepID=UPI000DEF90CC|nr:DUF2975 domain-containing protein [Dyella sp. C9]
MPTPESSNSPSPRLIRDGKLFSVLAALCLGATLLVDLLAVAAFVFRSGRVGLANGSFAFEIGSLWPWGAPGPALVPIDHYTQVQSLACAALLALRFAPGVVILWSLMRLFGMYGRGEVFTTRNEHYVRVMAWALIAYAVVPLITHATLYLMHMSPVAIRLEVRQLDALVAGLIVLALARVMSFGCAIDEDRKGFV